MLNDQLDIYLITYNRKARLERTFQQLFAKNSPIRDMRITILDNHSTDGTSELVAEYARLHPNLVHIRHPRNIGGVANSVRAFELASKPYLWILCDDDSFDWSNWGEVEEAIARGDDLICVARYALEDEVKDRIESQLLQLTFLPAGIYKTANFTSTMMRNAYDSIFGMLPQCCFSIPVVNSGKDIYVVKSPIVKQLLDYPE